MLAYVESLCSAQKGSHDEFDRSAVIENLSNTGDPFVYFYCDFTNDRSTKAFHILRSLLTQLLRKSTKSWRESFQDLVHRKSNGSSPPVDLEMLCNLLLRALELHDRPIVVIDALDECKDYALLVKCLVRLRQEGACRLFVTSRTLPEISLAFSGCPAIALDSMHDATRSDMKLHIEKEMDNRPKLVPFKDEIVTSLLSKADGMLVFAFLARSMTDR